MLMELDQRPRRTVLFLAITAEEKGLLGAEYFARNPTLADHEIVGNVNLDMPVLTYDFQDVVVFGGDRSSFRGAIKAASQEMDLVLAQDPFPEQGIFTRSDHFARTYHNPSDDMDNNINFEAAARFAELKTRITLQVANANERPLWNKDEYRRYRRPTYTN